MGRDEIVECGDEWEGELRVRGVQGSGLAAVGKVAGSGDKILAIFFCSIESLLHPHTSLYIPKKQGRPWTLRT